MDDNRASVVCCASFVAVVGGALRVFFPFALPAHTLVGSQPHTHNSINARHCHPRASHFLTLLSVWPHKRMHLSAPTSRFDTPSVVVSFHQSALLRASLVPFRSVPSSRTLSFVPHIHPSVHLRHRNARSFQSTSAPPFSPPSPIYRPTPPPCRAPFKGSAQCSRRRGT